MATKLEAQRIQDDVLDYLRKKYGNDMVLPKKGKYGPTGVTLTFEVVTADEEQISTNLKSEFERVCGMFGLLKSDFDLPLVLRGGQQAQLVAIDLKKRSYPFIVKGIDDGKRYKCGESVFLLARARMKQ